MRLDTILSRPLPLALGVNLVLFLVTYLTWTPGFQFNDDPMMMFLTAGVGRVIEPTILLNYSSFIIGWALKQLYAVTMEVPWYTLYLIAGLFSAHVTFLYLMLKRNPHVLIIVLYLAYFALIGVHLLLDLQFTISSLMVGTAGFLLVLTSGLESEGSGWGTLGDWLSPRAIVGFSMIVAGSLIRQTGTAQLAAVLTAPALALFIRRENFRRLFPTAGLAGLALVVSWGFVGLYDDVCSRNPDCDGWRAWNQEAIQILDNDAHRRVDAETNFRFFEEIGWSEIDFRLMATWFYMDEERYGYETIRELISKYPSWNVNLTAGEVVEIFTDMSKDPLVRNAVAASSFFLIFLVFDPRITLIVAATLLLTLTLTLYSALFHKPLPPRVYYAVFAYIALLPLLLLHRNRFAGFSRTGLVQKCIGALLLVLLLVRGADAFGSYRDKSALNVMLQQDYVDAIRELAPDRDKLFFAWTGAVAWQRHPPWGDLDYLKDLVAIDSRPFPSTRAVLRHFEIEDIHLALVTRDDVFLVVHSIRGDYRLQIFRQYMLEHYGLGIVYERIVRNNQFDVYVVSTEDDGPAAER